MEKHRGLPYLILWYLPVVFVQWISSRVTFTSLKPWYQGLQKAAWTPPGWVFGPVWTALYILMAISVWLVFRKRAPMGAYILFFVQLFFNGLWSWLFFGMHQPGMACINIVILLVLIGIMTVWYYRLDRVAGILQVPYFLWTAYASTLNFAIWWLN
ncbi:MAG: tryptophan-rich sensory protein [Simkaniaceae bacterium]|nr:tryptophan-rich sensory protein [Simkaniaceae bacterium]